MSWQQIPWSACEGRDAVAGAVPCVIRSRLLLVGGCSSNKNDGDIGLRGCDLSSVLGLQSADGNTEDGQQKANHDKPRGTSLELQKNAVEIAVKNCYTSNSSDPLRLVTTSQQEGDVPLARIGHSAVVSSTSSIILFGGEAATIGHHSTKFSDVFEGTLNGASTTVTWRSLHSTTGDEDALVAGANSAGMGIVASTQGLAIPPPTEPGTMAFHACCAATMQGKWVMLVHGGIDDRSVMLQDLWALRLTGKRDSNDAPGMSWTRLVPQGNGPPAAAYHSATPVNGGDVVVFFGGKGNGSWIFVLDIASPEPKWSSAEIQGLAGRCLHSAVAITSLETQRAEETGLNDEEIFRASAIAPTPSISTLGDESAEEGLKPLWPPLTSGALKEQPLRSESTEDDAHDTSASIYESIFIFGGVGEGAVMSESTLLRADGIASSMPFNNPSEPPRSRPSDDPGPRYNHAMVTMGEGQQQVLLLLGGCRGDGTRIEDAFLFHASRPDDGQGDGSDDNGAEESGDDATQTITFENGDTYTGQVDEHGRRHGQGRCDFADGRGHYVGEWHGDSPHGQGERHYGMKREVIDMGIGADCPAVSSYSGDWNRGVREGGGTCTFVAEITSSTPRIGGYSTGERGYCLPDAVATMMNPECTRLRGPKGAKCPPVAVPCSYDGEWIGGRPQGKGKLSLRSIEEPLAAVPDEVNRPRDLGKEAVIEGFWDGDQGLVRGRETLQRKGGVYEGQFHLGKREGQGRLELPDGSEYEGAWRSGRQNGLGVFRCGLTRDVYTGKWVGGVRCGKGVCEYSSGGRYEGLWLDDLRHGPGIFTSPSEDTLAGMWHRDKPVVTT